MNLDFLSWPHDKIAVCQKIEENRGALKVVLKTRNERLFLKMWLEHYLNFLKPHEILIADNMSDDPEVLELYTRVPPEIVLFQYESSHSGEYHNVIHNPTQFPEFYDSIEKSCEYYMIVDSDEFLIFFDEKSWTVDRETILKKLTKYNGKAVSSVWIEPISGSKSKCRISDIETQIVSGFSWGKPILPHALRASGSLIHNGQFDRNEFSYLQGEAFALLHLKKYSREQRLRINKQKLIVRGIGNEGMSFESLAAMDTSSHTDWVVGQLVAEIRQLLTYETNDAELADGDFVDFAPNGNLIFHTERAEHILKSALNSQDHILDIAFERVKNQLNRRASHQENDEPQRATEDLGYKLERLKLLMIMEPDVLDQYGDPTYRKELTRLLLSAGNWEAARALALSSPGEKEKAWPNILFARELERAGRFDDALYHWREVIRVDPSHIEAISALRRLEPEERLP